MAMIRQTTLVRMILLLLFLMPLRTSGQDQHLVGLGGFYEYGPSEDFHSSPEFVEFCNCPGLGRLRTTSAWWGISFFVPDAFSADVGWNGRLSYGSARGEFVSDTYPINGDTIHQYRSLRSASTLQLDLMGSWHVSSGARLLVGGWVNAPLALQLAEYERTISPDPSTSGLPREIPIADGSPRSGTSVVLGATLGLSLELPLSDYVSLVPEVLAHIDPEALVARNAGLGGVRIRGGTSIMFNLTELRRRREIPPGLIDTPEVDTPIPDASPTATVDLEIDESDGRRSQSGVIRHRLVDYRVTLPIVTSIAFEPRSDTLPQFRIAPENGDFSLTHLAQRSPHEMHNERLSVLALRLRQHPSTMITIAGYRTSDEARSLARSRAVAVRNYLHKRFNIALSRIHVTTGTANTAGVRIIPSSPLLVEPVVVTWREEQPVIPPFHLSPKFTAPRGVREWYVDIWYRGVPLGRYAGSNRDSVEPGEISIPVSEEEDSADAPLIAKLTLEDSSGAVVHASDELPLHVLPHRPEDPPVRVVHRVVWFPETRAAADSAERERSLQRLIAGLPSVNDSLATISIAPLEVGRAEPSPEGDATIRMLERRLREVVPETRIIAANRLQAEDLRLRDSQSGDEFVRNGIVVEIVVNRGR